MAKLMHFFLDVDLRCNHIGLLDFLKKKKIKIGPHDFIVFMNHKRTMIKMLCKGKEVLLHYKKDGRVLDPGIIKYLPKYVDGKEMNIEGAVKEHLEEVLARRRK